MIAVEPHSLETPAALLVDIGNTSVKLALWRAGAVVTAGVFSTGDSGTGIAETYRRLCENLPGGVPEGVAIASVVPAKLRAVMEMVVAAGAEPLLVGNEIDLPIALDVEEPERVGVDRICSAAAAHHQTGHACTVISFGTAITVDLVSDNGVFMGGAILPGLRLQAASLHEHTAQLPLAAPAIPSGAWGRSTEDAIRNGVFYGVIGAVRGLVERYATELGTWPQVVATGGDLGLVSGEMDFVDSLVPDLCLMGVGLAWERK